VEGVTEGDHPLPAADWLQRGCPRTPLQMTILTKPLLNALRAGTGTPPTSQGSQ
jgi:hypothetical protein